MAEYTGTSIVDYLKSTGQASDYGSRSKLATEKGITGYTGTATQNIQLLNALRGGSAPAPTSAPVPSPTPTTSAPAVTTTGAGEPRTVADLIKMGFTGYAGWNDTEALANYKQTGGEGKGSPINKTLDSYQSDLFKTSTAPEVKIPTMEELKTELAPTTAAPTVLNRVEEFKALRTEYGVEDLEKRLNDLKAEEDTALADLRTLTHTEEGKPVALNVISGRVTEEQRQAQENLDFIGRQKTRVTDELNTKYSVINTFMTFKGLDYQDAVTAYNTEFSNNLKLYDIITGAKKEARSEFEYDQTAARTNLQVIANAAISGNITYDDLPADTKLMIRKLEVQSGLPAGFIEGIKKDPKSDIIFTSTNEGVTQVGFRNADGTVSVQSYGTRIAGAGTETERKRTAFSEMQSWLAAKGGSDKFVSPDEWNYAKQLWLTQGYDGADFDNAFMATFVGDPATRGWDLGKWNISE